MSGHRLIKPEQKCFLIAVRVVEGKIHFVGRKIQSPLMRGSLHTRSNITRDYKTRGIKIPDSGLQEYKLEKETLQRTRSLHFSSSSKTFPNNVYKDFKAKKFQRSRADISCLYMITYMCIYLYIPMLDCCGM